MTNLLEEYAKIDAEISALETKKEQLRPHILQMMIDQGQKKIETALGMFTVNPLRKWTYPAYITKMNEDYKAAKAKAESTKEATCELVDSLRFTPVKL